MIVAHTRRRGGVTRVLCTHNASQHRVAAWRHSSPHLLALIATSGCMCPGVCALPRPSRSCHAAELPIVQPNIRHTTDACSVSGAQVDPLSRRWTQAELGTRPSCSLGFRNALVRARRMYLAAPPACITTGDLARRYQLQALSLAGESSGNLASPSRGWLN